MFEFQASSARETSAALFTAWLGLGANLILLGCYAVEAPLLLTGAALMTVGACLFVLIFSTRLDEHFNALRHVGLRWGMAVIALYLSASAILAVYHGGYSVGTFAAGAGAPSITDDALRVPVDGYLVMVLAALAFHLGFAFARVRGTGAA